MKLFLLVVAIVPTYLLFVLTLARAGGFNRLEEDHHD